MRDYYSAYLTKNIEISQGSEGAKGAEGAYAPFAPSLPWDIPENFSPEIPSAPFAPSLNDDIPENFSTEDLVLAPEDLEQFFYEIEERIAIMIYDGGMPEEEAEVSARDDVQSAWQRSKEGLAKLNAGEPIH